MAHGHRFEDVLDYPLPRITRLLAAVARHEAEQADRLLNLVALAARGEADDIRNLSQRLTDEADHAA